MKADRYIILLEENAQKKLKTLEKAFSVSVFSSEILSKERRANDIIDNQNAILYKNLNVLVFDDINEDQLKQSLKDINIPIVAYEKEREFYEAGETEIISEIKTSLDIASKKITELEKFIKNKPLPLQNIKNLEWGITAIGLQKIQETGKNVNVCILDTGLDISHPDFVNRTVEGKSFIDGELWDKDPRGHGTHCAGIVAGNVRSDNGNRYGVAKDVNLKIAKVISNNGVGSTSSIVDALDWAITKQFNVVSMSLASSVEINESPSKLFEEIGKRALKNDCLLIAAAGNDSSRPSVPNPVSSPANVSSVMAVAAIDRQFKVASFSNAGINSSTGGIVDFCAPGVDIFSAYTLKSKTSPKYQAMSGTSMATPFVAGVAAIFIQRFPDKSATEIWKLMEQNAKKIDGQKFRDIGNGLIQIPEL